MRYVIRVKGHLDTFLGLTLLSLEASAPIQQPEE